MMWEWVAGILASALLLVLGIITKAVMEERNGKKDPTAPLPWERYQADVLDRLDRAEHHIEELQKDCRGEGGRIEKIHGRLDLLTREDEHLKERIDRLDGQARS